MEMYNLVSLAGIPILLLFAWVLSADRRQLNSRLLVYGTGLQLLFAVFVFLVPAGRSVFLFLNDLVLKILESASAGTEFVFGRLALPPGTTSVEGETSLGAFLAFQSLSTVVFFASLMGILYYIGFMQKVIRGFTFVFTRLLGTSGAESLSVSSNIFVGIESALTIRPYLEGMTRSELCTILTGGMATIASSVLVLYVNFLQPTFPTIAGHLVSASILSAPAALVMSKLILPETGQPVTLGKVVDPEYKRESNLMEAVISGAMGGVRLAVGIAAMLLALLGLVALVDLLLGWIGGLVNGIFGWQAEWSLKALAQLIFYPFTLIIGIPPTDAAEVSRIIGERIIVTEIQSYKDLATLLNTGVLQHPRSAVVAAYALCGFTHFASMAIFIGGVGALVPSRTKDLAAVGFRALVAATLATLMTGAVAGAAYTSVSLLGV